ncbi:MAG TPA: Fic family protein, partial [Candidatus Babeliales bacterium]|nr:Fic family protein [Candidatus Babeliales bacterium]
DSANPGHFRSLGVRVGSLVPPPPQEVSKLMAELEKFINDNDTLPPLIKAGLAHVQFETIHPFLVGRTIKKISGNSIIPVPLLEKTLPNSLAVINEEKDDFIIAKTY